MHQIDQKYWTNYNFDLMVVLDEMSGNHQNEYNHPDGDMNVWMNYMVTHPIVVETFLSTSQVIRIRRLHPVDVDVFHRINKNFDFEDCISTRTYRQTRTSILDISF